MRLPRLTVLPVRSTCSRAHLPESPFQDISGADGFPALWRKVIKVQAVKEIFLHTN
jgi:hypothetical protein